MCHVPLTSHLNTIAREQKGLSGSTWSLHATSWLEFLSQATQANISWYCFSLVLPMHLKVIVWATTGENPRLNDSASSSLPLLTEGGVSGFTVTCIPVSLLTSVELSFLSVHFHFHITRAVSPKVSPSTSIPVSKLTVTWRVLKSSIIYITSCSALQVTS